MSDRRNVLEAKAKCKLYRSWPANLEEWTERSARALRGVTNPLLDHQLLKCRKLLGTGESSGDLVEIHRADLADHGLDAGS